MIELVLEMMGHSDANGEVLADFVTRVLIREKVAWFMALQPVDHRGNRMIPLLGKDATGPVKRSMVVTSGPVKELLPIYRRRSKMLGGRKPESLLYEQVHSLCCELEKLSADDVIIVGCVQTGNEIHEMYDAWIAAKDERLIGMIYPR